MSATADKFNVDIIKVLEICRDVELVSAELYNYFAEIFSEHEELAALWRKTAQEEESHAQQFVLALKMRREPLVEAVVMAGSRAEHALNIVKSLYDVVRKNKPTMLEALRAAIKLEQGLAPFHMSTVASFVQESHKELFSAMMLADTEHVEALEKFSRRFSSAG
jgi:rubrerythrin